MVVVAVGALGDPITITATFDAAFTVPVGFIAVVEATREYSNGTYRPKSQDFRQIGVIAVGTNVTAYNVATEYAGVFGAPSTIGSRVYIRIFLVSLLTGQVNLPQTSFNVVA